MNTWNPDGCCYHCIECERRVCRDEDPSPREEEGLCSDCVEVAA